MQEVPLISTEPWSRSVQVPLTGIDVGNEEVNQLLQLIQSIALDLNKLPAQVLVELQHVSTQELENRQKELTDGYMQL